ncbi:hypothetical protein G8A07_13570 [Roseateles sp. DAIF2]|uniref:prepilin-type N-terminal cleavage/methylation domain-containing protein n=1 Tax=Roseateles sp. DAIF2 TaxID=2714952 RepID=UPI0018A31046|nr:prepilin-type N-terminal cleavage/methylation domain-containing protein [Roseateles sp. DAIF2]QPF73845.1 hypothetical protein G8A07_13570 [Roseateles sp. DAIF2]
MKQRGITLVEALVALLIMAFGMVALGGLQGRLRLGADLARQRSEAVRLAQQDLETLRGLQFADVVADDPAQAFAQLLALEPTAAGDGKSNTSYRIARRVDASPDGGGSAVKVTVSWQDRTGQTSELRFDSFIARSDPRLAGALAVPPDGAPVRRPLGRHPAIPAEAGDLGDGRSLLRPSSGGIAWVFDNRSGAIVRVCSALLGAAPTAADVAAQCNTEVNAMLLSGFVRFSTGDRPDPEAPLDPALPLNLGLMPAGTASAAPPHQCFDNAPAAADPTRTEGVRFYCIVHPLLRSTPSWDARLVLLDLPLGVGGYRVCRYSANYDGDKEQKIGNAEHPLDYLKVDGPLTRQNFLVIRAEQACPIGHRVDPGLGHFFDSATVEHQPDPR